jgi:hypothetical protein
MSNYAKYKDIGEENYSQSNHSTERKKNNNNYISYKDIDNEKILTTTLSDTPTIKKQGQTSYNKK